MSAKPCRNPRTRAGAPAPDRFFSWSTGPLQRPATLHRDPPPGIRPGSARPRAPSGSERAARGAHLSGGPETLPSGSRELAQGREPKTGASSAREEERKAASRRADKVRGQDRLHAERLRPSHAHHLPHLPHHVLLCRSAVNTSARQASVLSCPQRSNEPRLC